jgi:hypothetical protein
MSRCRAKRAKVLITETAFGDPRYIFPPLGQTLNSDLHASPTAVRQNLQGAIQFIRVTCFGIDWMSISIPFVCFK